MAVLYTEGGNIVILLRNQLRSMIVMNINEVGYKILQKTATIWCLIEVRLPPSRQRHFRMGLVVPTQLCV